MPCVCLIRVETDEFLTGTRWLDEMSASKHIISNLSLEALILTSSTRSSSKECIGIHVGCPFVKTYGEY